MAIEADWAEGRIAAHLGRGPLTLRSAGRAEVKGRTVGTVCDIMIAHCIIAVELAIV